MITIEKNAGYEIVDFEQYDHKNAVVLARNPNTGMWATWVYNRQSEFFWGHYFDSRMDAKKDYHKRLAEAYDRPWEE